jgi:curved DNA-binding protein CbpA
MKENPTNPEADQGSVYKDLAKKFHPDKNPLNEDAELIFKAASANKNNPDALKTLNDYFIKNKGSKPDLEKIIKLGSKTKPNDGAFAEPFKPEQSFGDVFDVEQAKNAYQSAFTGARAKSFTKEEILGYRLKDLENGDLKTFSEQLRFNNSYDEFKNDKPSNWPELVMAAKEKLLQALSGQHTVRSSMETIHFLTNSEILSKEQMEQWPELQKRVTEILLSQAEWDSAHVSADAGSLRFLNYCLELMEVGTLSKKSIDNLKTQVPARYWDVLKGNKAFS